VVLTPTGLPPAVILVVDDEESVRTLAARILREAGHDVQTAADGTEALIQVLGAESAINVVVSDLKMPIMDGETLARRVTAHDPACRFVFISGYPGNRTLPGPLVAKPFRADELLRAVDTVLTSRPSLR
jgi:CheY-like chemotaxis protein